MFRKFFASAILAAITVFGFSSSTQAQLVDSETFRVQVNSLMSIQAPTALVSQLHDETDNDQAFPAQRWLVSANSSLGATAVFQTDQAFTHTVDSSYKRDADVTLSLFSGPAWTVTTPNAVTNYAGGAAAEVVSVSAASSTAGSAAFDLSVKLVEETFADLAAGDYEMTITGTLTAN